MPHPTVNAEEQQFKLYIERENDLLHRGCISIRQHQERITNLINGRVAWLSTQLPKRTEATPTETNAAAKAVFQLVAPILKPGNRAGDGRLIGAIYELLRGYYGPGKGVYSVAVQACDKEPEKNTEARKQTVQEFVGEKLLDDSTPDAWIAAVANEYRRNHKEPASQAQAIGTFFQGFQALKRYLISGGQA